MQAERCMLHTECTLQRRPTTQTHIDLDGMTQASAIQQQPY